MYGKKLLLILVPVLLLAFENSSFTNLADLDYTQGHFTNKNDANPDVGVISIILPPDTVDSNVVVAPKAIVKNFGDTTVSFPVIFREDAYSFYDVKQVSNLAPEDTFSINFNQWRIRLPRGIITVKCSTALANDIDNSNDALEKSIFCRVKDIAVLELCLPDTIDSGAIITPRARIKNLGNTQDLIFSIFKIGIFYSCTLEVMSPLQGDEDTLTFSSLTANFRGIHPTICTTALSGDVNPNNNFLTGTLSVRSNDFAVTQILSPEQIIPQGSQVTPKVLVTNYGTAPATCAVFFLIADSTSVNVFRDSNYITLEPGISDSLSFTVWNAGSGPYLATSYTRLPGDVNPHNDTLRLYFFAGTPNRDVGVANIIAPIDTMQRVLIKPKAEVKNFGNLTESFYTFFQITSSGNIVYFDSLLVANLLPNRTIQLTFSAWQPSPGNFVTKCSTALVGDMNLANDVLIGSVTIETLEIGWVARAQVPSGPKSKGVKAGGTLVYVPPTSIYAFKGNNTNEFYCYDIPTNNWTPKETIPWVGRKKRVKAGARLCYDNERYIYALKGGNTLEFWRYDTQKDSWSQLTDVPVGEGKPKKVKSGASLAFVPVSETQHLIYFLKGNGTFEFYAYWVEQDSWLKKPDAPFGPDNKKFKAGSCLAYDHHRQYLWTIKGGTNEFYAYDLTAGIWLENIPNLTLIGRDGKKRKAKDGAAIAYHPANHSIYALKGGNTDEFWSYTPPETTWTQLTNMPSSSLGKKVKAGGSLIYAAGNLYALRGNKTFDFFIYNFGSGVGIEENEVPRLSSTPRLVSLKIYPNPFSRQTHILYQLPSLKDKPIPVTITLYNIAGQVERVLVNELLPPGLYSIELTSLKLANGIYIVRMNALNQRVSQKLVITQQR